MKFSDLLLGSIAVGALSALAYWAWKDVTTPPLTEATPEEIERAFNEAMRHREIVNAYMSDQLNSDRYDKMFFNDDEDDE